MKPITLHPVSVLVGAALVGLSLVLSGAQTPKIAHAPKPEVVGQIPAAWWTHLVMSNPDTFVVPADRSLVVTLFDLAGSASALYADGVVVNSKLRAMTFGLCDNYGTRVVFPPGTTLTASGGVNLWGYLEPL